MFKIVETGLSIHHLSLWVEPQNVGLIFRHSPSRLTRLLDDMVADKMIDGIRLDDMDGQSTYYYFRLEPEQSGET